MGTVVKAPREFQFDGVVTVFLAGSIEMGAAENWQEKLTQALLPLHKDLVILNPRRDDWDKSWIQSIDNPQFKEQVDWELLAQEGCDVVVMYFDPKTKSPITLLELGLFAGDRMIVCCPEGFWRKGNVDIVCDRYGISVTKTIDELISEAQAKVSKVIDDRTGSDGKISSSGDGIISWAKDL